MMITKCDICKKQIKGYDQEVKVAPPGKFSPFALCLDCGKPVVRFLVHHGLVKKPKKLQK